MKRKIIGTIIAISYMLLAISHSGCGYTTRGFLDPQYRSVYVKPVVSSVEVTGETQEFTSFRSVPPFLDQTFTRALISRFSLDGNLKVVKKHEADLIVECTITDYKQSALRYDDDERIEEYRLKIYYTYKVLDSSGNVIKTSRLIANAQYALVGDVARSQDQATVDLLDDAARRLVDEIIEEW